MARKFLVGGNYKAVGWSMVEDAGFGLITVFSSRLAPESVPARQRKGQSALTLVCPHASTSQAATVATITKVVDTLNAAGDFPSNTGE
jgi:hypothetical protein